VCLALPLVLSQAHHCLDGEFIPRRSRIQDDKPHGHPIRRVINKNSAALILLITRRMTRPACPVDNPCLPGG
jgi:hypothetical protein